MVSRGIVTSIATGWYLMATSAMAGWCLEGKTYNDFSFTLSNGKTVSICISTDASDLRFLSDLPYLQDLTYLYGVLGEPPELEYSGPLLGTVQRLAGYSHSLADVELYRIPNAFIGEVTVTQRELEYASEAWDTEGFYQIDSLGYDDTEESAIIFRRAGWEYAVRSRIKLGADPYGASNSCNYSKSHLITLISPEGNEHLLR